MSLLKAIDGCIYYSGTKIAPTAHRPLPTGGPESRAAAPLASSTAIAGSGYRTHSNVMISGPGAHVRCVVYTQMPSSCVADTWAVDDANEADDDTELTSWRL
jgi:hypothetical protein